MDSVTASDGRFLQGGPGSIPHRVKHLVQLCGPSSICFPQCSIYWFWFGYFNAINQPILWVIFVNKDCSIVITEGLVIFWKRIQCEGKCMPRYRQHPCSNSICTLIKLFLTDEWFTHLMFFYEILNLSCCLCGYNLNILILRLIIFWLSLSYLFKGKKLLWTKT